MIYTLIRLVSVLTNILMNRKKLIITSAVFTERKQRAQKRSCVDFESIDYQ